MDTDQDPYIIDFNSKNNASNLTCSMIDLYGILIDL
jgi:hypothetical protein